MFSSDSEEWGTPAWLMAQLAEQYGEFDLDPAATVANAKARNYFTKEQDGLSKEWRGNVFVNPPYGRHATAQWIQKAVGEVFNGTADQVIMLLPVRTDTKWFHELVMPYASHIIFIQGRLQFERGGESGPAPFPSMLVVFDNWRSTQKRPLVFTLQRKK